MKFVTIALAAGVAAVGTFALAASTVSPLGAAPASGTGLPESQCLNTGDIQNHSVVDKNTLLIDSSGLNARGSDAKGLYRVTMRNGCLTSAISSDKIGILQAGRAKVCAPKDLGLTARSGVCAIDSIVKLTPEEVAALPRQLKP